MGTQVSRSQLAPSKQAAKRPANELTARGPAAPGPTATSLQRAVANPAYANSGNVLALQQRYGNRAVQQLLSHHAVQAKLTVGPAGDAYEQEADRVASQVLTMPSSAARPLQRRSEEGLGETMPTAGAHPLASTISPLAQRTAEEETELQTKRHDPQAGFVASSAIEAQLQAQPGSGSPLPGDVRAFMEPRFGADFSGVRLHTGSDAAQLNRQLSAQAFTHGQDIYLDPGTYRPGTEAGQHLLAHELTHVIQQGAAGSQAQRTPAIQRFSFRRKNKVAPEPEVEISATTRGNTTGLVPSTQDVVLKPNKETGAEKTEHNVDDYRDVLADYVKEAGTDYAYISQSTDMLVADTEDVTAGRDRYDELTYQKDEAERKLGRTPPKDPEFDKLRKRASHLDANRRAWLKALNEPDFGQALEDARGRSEKATEARATAAREKAVVEYLYDEVETMRGDIRKHKGDASRKERKTEAYQEDHSRRQTDAANQAKGHAQQGRLSFGLIKLRRTQVEAMRTHVQKDLDRLPGWKYNLLTKVLSGVASAGLGFLTFGLVGTKAKVNAKGYAGTGLRHTRHGRPFQFTFLNDIENQVVTFMNTLRVRPRGWKAVDFVSGILRFFNEAIVQNVINVAGKISLVTSVLATIIAGSSLGTAAPASAVLATISSIAAFVALIAAALKVVIDLVRVTVDGLAALINSDAKLANMLTGRALQSGLESLTDTAQAAGAATGPSTGSLIKGEGFINQFNVAQTTHYAIGQLTAEHSKGVTVGALAASVSQSTGAPLVVGKGLPVMTGKASESYAYTTQDESELGRGKHSRLEAPKTTDLGAKRTPFGAPDWMKSEQRKENELVMKAMQERKAKAVEELTPVVDKAATMGSKLAGGKADAAKLAELAERSTDTELDEQDRDIAHKQTKFFGGVSEAAVGASLALAFGQSEMQKL